eukprot:m.101635 g.101635  ORF g.101635 m.101635 type:complete len:118 (+) comp12515_c0_seq1:446-799(+)
MGTCASGGWGTVTLKAALLKRNVESQANERACPAIPSVFGGCFFRADKHERPQTNGAIQTPSASYSFSAWATRAPLRDGTQHPTPKSGLLCVSKRGKKKREQKRCWCFESNGSAHQH